MKDLNLCHPASWTDLNMLVVNREELCALTSIHNAGYLWRKKMQICNDEERLNAKTRR